jgi:hypothetical protein
VNQNIEINTYMSNIYLKHSTCEQLMYISNIHYNNQYKCQLLLGMTPDLEVPILTLHNNIVAQ